MPGRQEPAHSAFLFCVTGKPASTGGWFFVSFPFGLYFQPQTQTQYARIGFSARPPGL